MGSPLSISQTPAPALGGINNPDAEKGTVKCLDKGVFTIWGRSVKRSDCGIMSAAVATAISGCTLVGGLAGWALENDDNYALEVGGIQRYTLPLSIITGFGIGFLISACSVCYQISRVGRNATEYGKVGSEILLQERRQGSSVKDGNVESGKLPSIKEEPAERAALLPVAGGRTSQGDNEAFLGYKSVMVKV